MIEYIATTSIYVDDQQKALKFWTEQVGFEVKRKQSMGPDADWIEIAPNGSNASLVIYPKSLMTDWAERKPSIVFECDNIHTTFDDMAARGVEFVREPEEYPWGPFAIFRDIDGNEFGLRQS